ncbi:PilZ domain-containing protein [Oleiagrimonas sp. C23AA]|uniref:PilZ domain-containing protein n=1 Tax=Oleiagrimonas sp. C23AA TaxID=2719047 RepID=UPI001420B95D|nr:PilZ domain-containing protein [Oleiagrimonas sp. C23AA]NII09199.1 PilZ domain-containing protein [Oleiagrimonas sp. C23AA]
MTISTSHAWHEFSDRVAYEGSVRLNLSVRPLPDAPRLAQLSDMGAQILATLEAMEERRGLDDDSAIAHELARMDAKLNVLMELLNRALMPESKLPERQHLRFNAFGLSGAVSLPDQGSTVRVRLHFDGCRAMPLELFGQVASGTPAPFIAFHGVGETLREAIERMVFRHHRRLIADRRGARDAQ